MMLFVKGKISRPRRPRAKVQSGQNWDDLDDRNNHLLVNTFPKTQQDHIPK